MESRDRSIVVITQSRDEATKIGDDVLVIARKKTTANGTKVQLLISLPRSVKVTRVSAPGGRFAPTLERATRAAPDSPSTANNEGEDNGRKET